VLKPTYYDQIGGWFLPEAEDIYLEMIDRAKDGAVFVELGTWHGRSAAFMAEAIKLSGKSIKFYTVDNHRFYDDMPDDWRSTNGIGWERGTFSLDMVKKNLEPLKDYVEIVNNLSWEPIPGVTEVDFCWIDASHEYEDVRRDILYWLPRSKIIGGDDYGFVGVRKAVTELCPKARALQFWMLDPNPYYEGK
jgi:hypothetical protein